MDVTVANGGGTSATLSADRYSYDAVATVSAVSPTAGPGAGGTKVTISGAGFVSGASVKFGATASASVAFVSATDLTATAPAQAAGSVDVTVTTPWREERQDCRRPVRIRRANDRLVYTRVWDHGQQECRSAREHRRDRRPRNRHETA